MDKRAFASIIFLAALLMSGCSPIKNNVEKSVAEMMPDIIGPADSYSVNVYGSTFRLMKGKMDGLDIHGKNVRLQNGITITYLFVKIRDLRVNTDTKEIEYAGSTEYSAVLSESELNKYVVKQYPDVPELKIILKKGYMSISAMPGISKVRTTIQVNSELVIKDQRKLVLNLTRLKVGPITAPGFATEYIESRLDTIFDAKDLGFDARITSVNILPEGLVLSGNLDLIKVIAEKNKKLDVSSKKAK